MQQIESADDGTVIASSTVACLYGLGSCNVYPAIGGLLYKAVGGHLVINERTEDFLVVGGDVGSLVVLLSITGGACGVKDGNAAIGVVAVVCRHEALAA